MIQKIYKYGVKTTLSNCYVIAPPEDNIESIFECASKLARTYSYGGGCGIDISKLAPRGAKVNNTAKKTDDKEPTNTAGLPIYNILERKNLNSHLVAVIRYFGGIKLGAGGLLRAYSDAANEATKDL